MLMLLNGTPFVLSTQLVLSTPRACPSTPPVAVQQLLRPGEELEASTLRVRNSTAAEFVLAFSSSGAAERPLIDWLRAGLEHGCSSGGGLPV